MLLCGDIGGTKTTLALFARDAARAPERLNTYSSRAAKDLGEIVDAFLAGERVPIDGACFGVPGPVQGPVMRTTNLPWTIDARQLGERLGGVPVFLLNDLEALAWGVARAPEESSAVLNPGRPVSHGTMAVIAAGTGLGEAGLVWTPTGYLPFASEGGHADFGPRTDREVALLRHLRARFDHVSYERVLSGSGMVHLFEFLREGERLPVPAALATAMAEGDPAGAITEAALAGAAPIASETVAMFVTIYGAEAGNLALKLKATGGVWVGGGIVRKILPLMQDDRFVEAFLAKGRLRGLLADVPVRVILDENTALYGALGYAASRVDASHQRREP